MTGWTAVVPIKPLGARKTRLSMALAPDAIDALTEWMFRHVLESLSRSRGIGEILVLSAQPPDGCRDFWWPDKGANLNAALQMVAIARPRQLAIVHADLPQLSCDDVDMLVAAAGSGSAIAPDLSGHGTNALGLGDAAGMAFGFGVGSFARHRAALPDAAIVRRAGLAVDIDHPQDVRNAVAAGTLPAELNLIDRDQAWPMAS